MQLIAVDLNQPSITLSGVTWRFPPNTNYSNQDGVCTISGWQSIANVALMSLRRGDNNLNLNFVWLALLKQAKGHIEDPGFANLVSIEKGNQYGELLRTYHCLSRVLAWLAPDTSLEDPNRNSRALAEQTTELLLCINEVAVEQNHQALLEITTEIMFREYESAVSKEVIRTLGLHFKNLYCVTDVKREILDSIDVNISEDSTSDECSDGVDSGGEERPSVQLQLNMDGISSALTSLEGVLDCRNGLRLEYKIMYERLLSYVGQTTKEDVLALLNNFCSDEGAQQKRSEVLALLLLREGREKTSYQTIQITLEQRDLYSFKVLLKHHLFRVEDYVEVFKRVRESDQWLEFKIALRDALLPKQTKRINYRVNCPVDDGAPFALQTRASFDTTETSAELPFEPSTVEETPEEDTKPGIAHFEDEVKTQISHLEHPEQIHMVVKQLIRLRSALELENKEACDIKNALAGYLFLLSMRCYKIEETRSELSSFYPAVITCFVCAEKSDVDAEHFDEEALIKLSVAFRLMQGDIGFAGTLNAILHCHSQFFKDLGVFITSQDITETFSSYEVSTEETEEVKLAT